MAEDPHSIEDVADGLADVVDGADEVSIGDVLDEFGYRSFGPLLFFLPLLELSPLGGIPAVPTVIATIIALIALQMVFAKDHIWLPDFIEKRSIKASNVKWAGEKLKTIAGHIDGVLHERLGSLSKGVMLRVIGCVIIALCAMVPPLEVVPFASSLPMLGIAALGLAIIAHDGLLVLLAGCLSSGSIYLVATSLGSGGSG